MKRGHLAAGLRLKCGGSYRDMAALGEAVFPTREGFSLEAHIRDYSKAGLTYPARVWIADAELGRARVESHATLAECGRRDGGVEFTLLTWSYEWLAGWLFSFGGAAEAVSPPELRSTVRRLADAVLARHADTLSPTSNSSPTTRHRRCKPGAL